MSCVYCNQDGCPIIPLIELIYGFVVPIQYGPIEFSIKINSHPVGSGIFYIENISIYNNEILIGKIKRNNNNSIMEFYFLNFEISPLALSALKDHIRIGKVLIDLSRNFALFTKNTTFFDTHNIRIGKEV